MRQFFRLIIFAIVMLLGAAAFGQDIKVPFAVSAPAPNKYAFTPNGIWTDSVVKMTKYAMSDTALLLVATDGKLFSVDFSTFVPVLDSSVYVTITRLTDSLADYQRILGFTPLREINIVDSGAVPYDSSYCNRYAIQSCINEAMGVFETSYDSLAGAVTYVRVRDSFVGGKIVAPDSIYFVKNRLIKTVNGRPFNGQIYVPSMTFADSNKKKHQITLEICGAYPIDQVEGILANVQAETWINGGTRIQSTLKRDGSDWASIIASEPGDSSLIGTVWTTPSAVFCIMRNIHWRSAYDATEGGMQIGNVDFDNFLNHMMIDCRTDANVSAFNMAAATTNNVFNIRCNSPFSGLTGSIIRGLSAHAKIGIVTGEHNYLDHNAIMATTYGIELRRAIHTVDLGEVGLYWNKYQFHTGTFGTQSGGGVADVALVAGSIKVESPSSGPFVRTSPDFMDSTNIMTGTISMIAYSNATGFGTIGTVPSFYRATRLRVIVPAELNGGSRANFGEVSYWNGDVRSGPTHKNLNSAGVMSQYMTNDRANFGSNLQCAVYGSGLSATTIASTSIADVAAIFADGGNSRGMLFGTRTSDSLRVVTNGALRAVWLPAGDVNFFNGVSVGSNLTFSTAGRSITMTTGSNAKFGTATLSSGTVTVNTTAVTANSRIFLTTQTCSSCGYVYVSAKTASASFTITSSNVADASTVAWWIIEGQ